MNFQTKLLLLMTSCRKMRSHRTAKSTLLAMKLTSIILLSACLQVHAKGYSQITLSETNVPLQKVFKEIQKQSGYDFLCAYELLQEAGTVTIKVNNVSLQQAVVECLKGKGLSFEIQEKTVVIKKNPEPAVDLGALFPPPPISIHGRVTDSLGNPLAGASVTIKGSGKGMETNNNGEYTIDAAGNSVLIISYLGYIGAEIPVNGRSAINIVLQPVIAGLNEVVVVGYGTQKKKDLTSAITSVDTKALDDRSLSSMSNALEGITPGVYIRQENGRPGISGASLDIRGASLSTFSDNPPLVIIDGVVDNIEDINPADVASISILKDAAASAIYGARATGGVILITTKRGSSGKVVINYNGIAGVQRQPYGNLKFVNTATWMKANNEAAELDGSADVYTAADIQKYTNSTDPQFPQQSQWGSWIAKTAPQQTHNISVKGGNGKINFYLSGGLLKQNGFVPNDNFDRKNVLLNLDYHPNSRLEISTNFSYLRNDQTTAAVNYNGGLFGAIRNAFLTPPTQPLYNANGTYNNNVIWGSNPAYDEIYGGDATGTSDNFRMSLTLKYEIFKDLSFDMTTAARLSYAISNTLATRIPYYDANGAILGYNRSNTAVSEGWGKSNYVNNQFLLEYKKSIGLHDFRIMGGIIYENEVDNGISASASQFPNNEIREITGTTGSGSQISGSSNADEWTINSVIGRFNYSFKDKFLFQSSIRFDGSSRFSPNKRWGTFPSFSGAWKIKKESFLKNVNFISDLKLRASWGQLGNQGANLYPFAQAVSFGGKAVFGNGIVSTASLGGPVNLDLTWEKQNSRNIGLDFGFLGGRLSGSFDHFNTTTSSIIGTPPVPSTFGTSAPLSNLYTIDTRGFELELHWNDKIGSLKYFVGVNLSNSVDKVANLAGLGATNNTAVFGNAPVVISGNTYMQVGKSRNQWYLLKTDGLFTSQDEINKAAVQTSLTRPGDIHYVDANGDGKIDANDTRPIGKTNSPHYFFGLHLGVEYANFDLSAVLNGVWQRWDDKIAGGTYLVGVRPDLNLLQANYDHRWTTQNPDKNAKEPRLTQNNWVGNLSNITQASQFRLANFGYARVRNLQLGYTLPKRMTDRLSIVRARFYVSAENLFTYKPGYIEPIDPESNPGFDANASAFFGPDKLVSFGVNITF
jgi:TonB-linked SusC/RagA family outer membrane protein